MNEYYQNDRFANAPSLSNEKANAFLRRVFLFMGIGIAITALVSWFLGQRLLFEIENGIQDGVAAVLFTSPVVYLVMFAPFIFVMVISFGVHKLSAPVALGLFFTFAAVMGISLSSIFVIYTSSSIALALFITAGTFGAMALLGATTKMDLTKMGSLLYMALIGIIIASLVNLFMNSAGLQYLISMACVVVFTGLTAYDTQALLKIGAQLDNDSSALRQAVLGALTLYLNFINLLLSLLRLFGDRR